MFIISCNIVYDIEQADMIFRLAGKIILKDHTSVVVDVNGVGYEALISLHTYSKIGSVGDDVIIYTHYVSRDDGVYLFGFEGLDEKKLFLQLITVSGIGPKVAVKILGGVGGDNLKKAIASEDSVMLTTIPGIGKKSAERIIVELKDKFSKDEILSDMSSGDIKGDVLSALVNLGYKQTDAHKSLDGIDLGADFEFILRKALTKLAGKQ